MARYCKSLGIVYNLCIKIELTDIISRKSISLSLPQTSSDVLMTMSIGIMMIDQWTLGLSAKFLRTQFSGLHWHSLARPLIFLWVNPAMLKSDMVYHVFTVIYIHIYI